MKGKTMGMSASMSLESEIRVLGWEAEMGIDWAQRELAVALARRDVRQLSRSLEDSRRTRMTSDLKWGGRGMYFMLADSHKIITRLEAQLAQAQARLALAVSQR